MATTQERIINIIRESKTKEKVDSRIQQLEQTIAKESKAMEKLVRKIDKEAKDVQKMEKTSIKSVFYKVLGSKEKQLEKERQEYLELSLKYDEAKKSIDLLEYELSILIKKSKKLKNKEGDLKKLFKKREKELARENPRVANALFRMEKDLQRFEQTIFEMEEAISVGNNAAQILERIISYLNQARNWGNWDMAGRRGYMASQMKHSQIDRAKDQAYNAKYVLRQFEKELKDVYVQQNFNLTVTFDSFSRFTDIFFDNLLSDWIIQQRIHNTLANVRSVYDKVQRLTQTLNADIQRFEVKITDLEDKREEMLMKA